jgi:hypothetical protein
LDAEGAGHPHLVRYGEGDAPGPVLDLAVEEPGCHRGLAVRGEGEAVAGRVRLHELEVVLQALGGEGEDGSGEAVGEEVAALGGQLADRQAVGVGREALETVVDELLGERGEPVCAFCGGVGGGVGGGHGASLLPKVLHYMQRSLRIALSAV